MSGREALIADLLMGAAYADGHLDGRELQRVRQLLRKATGSIFLDDDLRTRMRSFEPASLDVEAAVAALALGNLAEKRQLLELIAAVHEADDTWDISEDDYLRGVAEALGLPAEAYRDLVVADIAIESIGKALLPPPLPKSKG